MKSAFSLHNVFGDHMVLQRRKPIRIAGTAFRGLKVHGRLDNAVAQGEANSQGEWVLEFPPMEAGGPYELTVSTPDGAAITCRDILVGEVWFCSGQSNMEFHVHCPTNKYYGLRDGAAIASAANDDGLRLLQIPRAISPDELCTENPTGSVWRPATTPEAVTPFSAVGYWFGMKLREELGVPVGLINGSWGGTRIEPWIPRTGYLESGNEKQLSQLDAFLRAQYAKISEDKPFEPYGGEYRDWILKKFRTYAPETTAEALANWMKPGNEPERWKDLKNSFNSVLTDVGVVWFRCEVELPFDCVGKNVVLHCDFCDDCDEAYVDGEKVGETSPFTPSFWSIPRDYAFQVKPTASGRHTIVWRISNHFNVGLFGSHVSLLVPGVMEKPLDVLPWQYRVEFRVDVRKIGARPLPPCQHLGGGVFDPQSPTTLYNAMVHPSTFMNICGAIWYQGCSNASTPDWYAVLQDIQIQSWRKAWRDPKMPFLITQLAAFSGQHRPENRLPDDFWKDVEPLSNPGYAPFRQMQSTFLDYPGAGVACTIDVGDHSDIHPADKKSVGYRLAHEALRVAYGDASRLPGPRFASARRVPGGVEVTLRDIGSGLTIDGGTFGPHLFVVVGEKDDAAWTDAELRPDGTLFVKDGGVGEVVRVEYAYSAFPPNPPLRRKDDGLPVFPFSAAVTRE